LLLKVVPRPDGQIEDNQAQRLLEIGKRLQQNGGSIYETRIRPYTSNESFAATRAGNVKYLHILKWHQKTIKLPTLPAQIKQSKLLTRTEIKCKQSPQSIEITMPKKSSETR